MNSNLYKSLFILTIVSLILAACGGATAGQNGDQTPIPTVISETNIVAEGNVVPQENKQLVFFSNGQVEELSVKEGDSVKKGDVLARLGNREQLEAAIAGAEAELVSARQARQRLDDDLALAQATAADTIADANKALKDAQYSFDNFTVPQNMLGMTPLEAIDKMKELLDLARAKFEPYRYYPSGNETRKDLKEKLDNAQADYNTSVRWLQLETNVKNAKTRLEQSMDDYETLLKGPDPDAVEAADARIKATEENLAAAQANLDNMDLEAPIDGSVVQVDLVEGQLVTAGQPVALVADLSQLFAETDDLTEIEVVDIEMGQKVTIVADALPDIEMTGTVEKIDQVFVEKRGDITYTVRVRIDNPDPRLRWGMTVVITFEK
jgi:multidrug efflux pump subunit AcrA (membrane-fusion protein)